MTMLAEHCPPLTVHPSRFMEIARWCRIEVGVQGTHWAARPSRTNSAYRAGLDGWDFSFATGADAAKFWLFWYGNTETPPDR